MDEPTGLIAYTETGRFRLIRNPKGTDNVLPSDFEPLDGQPLPKLGDEISPKMKQFIHEIWSVYLRESQ